MGDGGGAKSSGPSPEMIGLAGLLAAAVGLGSIRLLTGRRRRPLVPAPVAAKTAVESTADEWTNVRLDDNDALPSWLRALPAEDASRAANADMFAMARMPLDPAPEPAPPAQLAQTFAEPLEPGAMRLAVTAEQTELLDQPSDLGVTLTTLVAGDEVEIKDLEEPWVRVVTPIGSTGWLRATTLGVGGPPPAEPLPAEPPERPEPKRRSTRTQRRTRAARSET